VTGTANPGTGDGADGTVCLLRAGADFLMRATAMALATSLDLTLTGFLVAKRGPDLASFALACFVARRTTGLISFRLGLLDVALLLRAAAIALATDLTSTLRCFLVAKRATDSASFASALARIFLNPAKSALARLACFLARRAISFTSLRLRLAARACSLAAFHRLSAVATQRRAI